MEDPLAQIAPPLRVLLCCEEPVCELGLRLVVESVAGASVLRLDHAERASSKIVAAASRHRPQVIVWDLLLDPELSTVAELRMALPRCQVVLWAREFSTELARQAMSLGVRGFLSSASPAEKILECVGTVAGGHMWLEPALSNILLDSRPLQFSRRQRELLQLLMQGLKNREIATAMGISEGTVKAYLTTMFEKVGARDRFELALFGLRNFPGASGWDSTRWEQAGRVKIQVRSRETRPAGAVA